MISQFLVLHIGEAHEFNEIVSKIIGEEWEIWEADKK